MFLQMYKKEFKKQKTHPRQDRFLKNEQSRFYVLREPSGLEARRD